MGLFNYFFNKKHLLQPLESEFDYESAVRDYLLRLPRCCENIVIASPKYREEHYKCEIIMAADDLQVWAEEHAKTVVSIDHEAQTARLALPLWLASQRSTRDGVTYIQNDMYQVIRAYIPDLLNTGKAAVYCLECDSIVDDVTKGTYDRISSYSWVWWTDKWTCPKGHTLYHKKQEVHFYRRLKKADK